jgi:hypothetical protein
MCLAPAAIHICLVYAVDNKTLLFCGDRHIFGSTRTYFTAVVVWTGGENNKRA